MGAEPDMKRHDIRPARNCFVPRHRGGIHYNPFMELSHSRHGECDVIALPVDRLDAENTPWFKDALGNLETGGGPLLLDLRSIAPLDRDAVVSDVGRTGRLLVVDEDYRDYGLTGELEATILEAGLTARYARVAVEGTIPFNLARERAVLPNVERIAAAARCLMK